VKLSLGVHDIAYSDPDNPGTTTTGQVAEILEKKYHVMRVFYELEEKRIGDLLTEGVAKTLKAREAGHVVPERVPLRGEMEKIDAMFRDYLDADLWQSLTGKTIAAAAAGISHRKKAKKNSGPRPAFIDTGQYQASFSAMIKK
jgi:hypothetical protein